MADESYNIIKPVEGMRNIAGPSSVDRREQRRRRRDADEHHENESENLDESTIDNDSDEQPKGKPMADNPEDAKIDYCA